MEIEYFDRYLLFWLVNYFDTEIKILSIRQSETVTIDEEMVGWVTGFLWGVEFGIYPKLSVVIKRLKSGKYIIAIWVELYLILCIVSVLVRGEIRLSL